MHFVISDSWRAVRAGIVVAIALGCGASALAADARAPASKAQVERGRYLAVIGGCNDCHTEGFAPTEGKVPEPEWLKGSVVGYRGPWGTTYPPNLRAYVAVRSADQFVTSVRALRARPPMPWFTLTRWTDADLRALYAFVRQLGPVGDAAPTFLPPDREPKPPYIQWPAPPK